MAQTTERKMGEKIPDWAKKGPIDLRNYSYRVELHCKARAIDRDGTHPTIKLGTPECALWQRYFLHHLGGYPMAMQMLVEKGIEEMAVPESVPQWFDPSFDPERVPKDANWSFPVSRPRARAPIPKGEDYFSMVAKHGVPVEPDKPTKLASVIQVESEAEVMARLGMTEEEWAAIENAPTDSRYWQGRREPTRQPSETAE